MPAVAYKVGKPDNFVYMIGWKFAGNLLENKTLKYVKRERVREREREKEREREREKEIREEEERDKERGS